MHMQATGHEKNYISKLKVDDVMTSDHEVMAEAVDSFANLLGVAPDRAYSLDLIEMGMPTYDKTHLEGEFTEAEIRDAVRAQDLDKAPGPDGFSTRFYVVCWPIIKDDVL